MKPLDYVLISVTLLLAAGLFIFNVMNFGVQANDTDLVVIKVDGQLYGEYPLNQNTIITIASTDDEGYNLVEIKDRVVTMIEADCNDLICVKTRPITKANQSIVCLPYRVVVELTGHTPSLDEGEVDDISR